MKPLILTMSAFGPYANVEVIDFTKLKGRNIFLITGPTGAGKTTIFDGISYAIYGYANGEDRDGESLRSHFANEDTLTYVELEFELKDKKYYIKRIPKQIRKKAKGEGVAEQKPEAELVCFFNDEKKVFTGVNNVNAKIEEIMGINHEQFRQIMMIPQGEFRKLIIAESKEREKILQKIFGTEGYKKVEYALVDMAKEIYSSIKKYQENLNENASRISCTGFIELENEIKSENRNYEKIMDFLKQLLLQDEKSENHFENSIEENKDKIEKKQAEIIKTEDNNKKLMEKQQLEEEKNELMLKKQYMEQISEKVTRAKNAELILGTEKNLIDRKNDLKNKCTYVETANANLINSEKGFKFSKERFQIESSKEEKRNSLLKEITLLKGYLDRAKEIDSLNFKLENSQKELKNIIIKRDKTKEEIEELRKSIEKLNNEFQDARVASIKHLEASKELNDSTKLQGLIVKLHKENNELVDIRTSYTQSKKKWEQDKKLLQDEKQHFEEMQEEFFSAQAGVLAEKLKEGMPCPVCGSIHHPCAAKKEGVTPSEDNIKEEKEKIIFLEEKENSSRENFSMFEAKGISQKKIVDNVKDEINLLIEEDLGEISKDELSDFINKKEAEVDNKVTELNKLVLDLENKKNLEEKINKKMVDSNSLLKQMENNLEIINESYNRVSGDLAGLKASKIQLEKELPEEARCLKTLEEKIKCQEKQYQDMQKIFKEAQEEYKAQEIVYEKNKSDVVAAEKAVLEAKLSLKDVVQLFSLELSAKGFTDENQYEESKLPLEEIKKIDEEIKNYNESLKLNIDKYDKILIETKGINYLNMDELKQHYENLKDENVKLIQDKTELFSKIQNNKNVLSRIEEIQNNISSKEEEYKLVGDLAETAKGNNSERITFERYVLAAFFDDIIVAANIRLRIITEGRYELNRITEKGKGLTQSGLELQIFDNYTGRYRHVKTLSGGESFKASLSMALGLADVVQSYAGGISLDTMFIDEGFGTLDSESLENAIECLIELQKSGRLVGIISHVTELKERIDAKLEIEPSNQGSTARFNVG